MFMQKIKVSFTSKKDWLKLKKPNPNSHKGENGILLVIAGSKKYFGAVFFAIEAAIRFCDLVYVYSPENKKFLEKLKLQPHIILINKNELKKTLNLADAILIGPGMDLNKKTKNLVNQVLKLKKPCVLDAAAIKLANKNLFSDKTILTPHKKEFFDAFSLKPSLSNVYFMAKKYNTNIILKGREDIICNSKECKINKTGNVGLTKGGTGDCLAGLLSALLARGNDPFLAASAAAFLNGFSADLLKKKYSIYYNTFELTENLAIAAALIEKNKK